MTIKNNNLDKYGFSFKKGSVHTKRTMMLNELTTLFNYIDDIDASYEMYKEAIIDENCTGKPSGSTRKFTANYLRDLYILDTNKVLFRALCFFWERAPEARPILAFLTAYVRDPLLQNITPFILRLEENQPPSKVELEEFIENLYPDRYSPVMKASLGRNLLSTWTQAGFLVGRRNKTRVKSNVTAGAISYALLISYLAGNRGENLLENKYANNLECSFEDKIDLASEASRKGWIVLKRIGKVIEVQFPNLLTDEEMEWLRE
ncbi:MAG: hypothetical protein B6I17_03950 [Tenericutes bacterium 4572_104]|nr:MAG: hypothetical protein B6I17_03950 [Tenericutes bacterium 4572_104]